MTAKQKQTDGIKKDLVRDLNTIFSHIKSIPDEYTANYTINNSIYGYGENRLSITIHLSKDTKDLFGSSFDLVLTNSHKEVQVYLNTAGVYMEIDRNAPYVITKLQMIGTLADMIADGKLEKTLGKYIERF